MYLSADTNPIVPNSHWAGHRHAVAPAFAKCATAREFGRVAPLLFTVLRTGASPYASSSETSTPQRFSFILSEFRWMPRIRDASLRFHCTRSSTRSTI